MMLGKVLLYCPVIPSLIQYAGHIILYAGRHLHKMHIPYVHIHAYEGGSRAGRFISIMPFVLSVSHQGIGAGINTQPAYLSSAVHLEPVFMYRVRCVQVSLFSFQPKGI